VAVAMTAVVGAELVTTVTGLVVVAVVLA